MVPGLSVSQMSVLWQVLQEGPVTAAGLAAAQHVGPQAIAQNLAVLTAAGLIHTERDPGDGRKTPHRPSRAASTPWSWPGSAPAVSCCPL